jgi:hypothetical protein
MLAARPKVCDRRRCRVLVHRPNGETHVRVVVILQGEAQLLEIVVALRAAGSFARGLNGGQQQRYEYADDGDHHQQLHQRKTKPPFLSKSGHDDYPQKRVKE